MKHIAVAGNIGAGKTTLVKKLATHFDWDAHFESVEDNPYLADFYEDMKKWSFPLQIYFLHSRFNQVVNIRNRTRTTIQDRTIYEDAHIFAMNLHKSEMMESRDFENYFSLFQSMSKHVNAPDLLIYLRADVEKLQQHIQKRGRDYEASISGQYLADLNEHYEAWIANYQEGNVLIIDMNKLDYVNNAADMAWVIETVEKSLENTERAAAKG